MQSLLNDSAEKFIEGLENFSLRPFHFPTDVKKIITHSFQKQQIETLHDLSFNAKYIVGLQRSVNKSTGNTEIRNLPQMKEDLASGYKKTYLLLNTVIADMGPEWEHRFKQLFLETTHESFERFTGLLEDLEQVKVYFNNLKAASKRGTV